MALEGVVEGWASLMLISVVVSVMFPSIAWLPYTIMVIESSLVARVIWNNWRRLIFDLYTSNTPNHWLTIITLWWSPLSLVIWLVDCSRDGGGGGGGGSACKVVVRVYCTVFFLFSGCTLLFPLPFFSPSVPLEALLLCWIWEPPCEVTSALAFDANSSSLLCYLSLAISVRLPRVLGGCVAKGTISPLDAPAPCVEVLTPAV